MVAMMFMLKISTSLFHIENKYINKNNYIQI